ncbi:MAG: DUF4965 domain-containing protein [Phycisphaeraceae bacterium]
MQLMSWMISRLGSRFTLLFEPYRRRVMHSAVGRFLDEPLDLKVGLEEPDGTQRVLPLTQEGELLHNCEQFERVNSITFRGYSEKYNLRFEFNVHSVFYPQDERLCVMPAFYLEMRVNPVDRVRWSEPAGPTPDKVKLFIRLRRPGTQIVASPGGDGQAASVDLAYQAPLTPGGADDGPSVAVRERIISLNPECTHLEDGDGLACELPVTQTGSGVKWRLVWAAHVAEPVLDVQRAGERVALPFRYTQHWSSLEDVLTEAIDTRDDHLAHSRRFEKLLEQAPLAPAQRHLLHQGFQNWLSNTFWCHVPNAGAADAGWFSVWEGQCFYHSTIDVEYNVALVYLTLWPRLLGVQFAQWAEHAQAHAPSGGRFLSHDIGKGASATGQAYPHPMEVEENCNYLLLLQAYTHWTADRTHARAHAGLVADLARYLLWTDIDGSGFPSTGVANTIDDASPATQFSPKQTYLAVKRLSALRAAGDLLTIAGDEAFAEFAARCEAVVEADTPKVERAAWLGDHYAVCTERSAHGVVDAWTGKPLPYESMPGWDAYSIYAGNGLLLPLMVGQPQLLDERRLKKDIYSALRENLSRYGCGHTSAECENVWISQNLWRDHLARYLLMREGLPASHYWDMQVMSNTHDQSLGFVDTYINNNLCFYPRGVTAIGYLLAGPRLIVDRLAAGGLYITVEPDRDRPQRWPLLALADWKAGKIPVCVVDEQGEVTIESRLDPVIVHGEPPTASPDASTNAGLIG